MMGRTENKSSITVGAAFPWYSRGNGSRQNEVDQRLLLLLLFRIRCWVEDTNEELPKDSVLQSIATALAVLPLHQGAGVRFIPTLGVGSGDLWFWEYLGYHVAMSVSSRRGAMKPFSSHEGELVPRLVLPWIKLLQQR